MSAQQREKEKEKMTLTSQKEQQEGRLPIIEIIVTQRETLSSWARMWVGGRCFKNIQTNGCEMWTIQKGCT